MAKPQRFRWQLIPFTVMATVGLVSLPPYCIGLAMVWADFLNHADGSPESVQMKWMIVFVTVLCLSSVMCLFAAVAWWKSQNLRGTLFSLSAMLIWALSYVIWLRT